MSAQARFNDITPSVFLRRGKSGLEQLVRVSVESQGRVSGATVAVAKGKEIREFRLGDLPEGKTTHEVFVETVCGACDLEFGLKSGGRVLDRRTMPWRAPKRWTVHVTQLSHHDVGYTNLASVVLREHDQFLDSVIDMAAATAGFPEEAQFRVVVEQAWTIDHYLKNAPADRVAQMVELMRSGHVEVTALFGNMTTELCGHEALARTVYHAFRLKRKYGIPLVSAQHNDVPGVCWGLCSVLVEAGIKVFFPRFPYYYDWGGLGLQGFWDEKALFRHAGPGAFWWEDAGGRRVLLYSGRRNGGGCRADLPGLSERLLALEQADYPYSVLRWVVGGGARDNAPYIEGYAHTIRAWNEKWTSPRLVSSTDSRFYQDFLRELPEDLPVVRGELPGQDYPSGSTSTAGATAANRNNHSALMTSERLATFAAASTDFAYPTAEIDEAVEGILWHDEHTWGHHFPCGPTSKAAELEKSLHAHRSAAFLHDVTNRALARIADHVKIPDDGFHLVVFNPSPYRRSELVRAPLRELENCGSTMHAFPVEGAAGQSYLRGVALGDRWHAHPGPELVAGRFDLVDLETGQKAPFQIVDIESPDATVSYAAQRFGLGAGGKRYGFFEAPSGLRRDLLFLAKDVPPCGYRTYRLAPRDTAPAFDSPLQVTGTSVQNEFYAVTFDPSSGRMTSIVDRQTGQELLDAKARFGLGDLLVRTPEMKEPVVWGPACISVAEPGALTVSICREGSVVGHPAVRETLSLFAGLKRMALDVRILKDATPLLDAHLAFPFACTPPEFRYEGALSVMTPIKDYLPGAYSDAIPVQNWVRVSNGQHSILWSSLDAPMVNLGGLWPGYVSPAHSCVVGERAYHAPLKPEDIKNGWIFSTIFCNNFGTNFYCSQTGDFLFRYVFSSIGGSLPDWQSARFGWEAHQPFEQIFTQHKRPRPLPETAGFLEIWNPEVLLVACKRAEDGDGTVLRLWNTAAAPVEARVRLPDSKIERAWTATLAEEGTGTVVKQDGDSLIVPVPPHGCVTVRVQGRLFCRFGVRSS